VQQAKAIAALDKPVMIRWFWEMEFTGNNGGQQGARAGRCIGSAGPAGYIAAWRHIVTVFRANGAINVAWVFCPGQDAYSPNAQSRGRAASSFYPGDSYVDWIAEDAYSRAKPVPMTTLVANMYREYGNSGKPLIVCETGAETSYQPNFLASFQSLPSEYPNLKAVVYFNSHGPLGKYVLSAAGVTAFQQLADSPNFSAQPSVP
jgi:beta-mannanase